MLDDVSVTHALICLQVPSDAGKDICVLNAELHFLEHLAELHRTFPRLRIILEHATTRQAVDMVCVQRVCAPGYVHGPIHNAPFSGKVAGVYGGCNHHSAPSGAHHRRLGRPGAPLLQARRQVSCRQSSPPRGGCSRHVMSSPCFNLRRVRLMCGRFTAGDAKFFMGSDSAPHPRASKETACAHAGVYTAPLLMPYIVTTLSRLGASDDAIRRFTSENGMPGMPCAQATLLQRGTLTLHRPSSYFRPGFLRAA